jgi:hypothetical protein
MSRNIFETLQAALEYVQINVSAYEIVIVPPELHELTDEEEGNAEDIQNTTFVQDVPGELEVVADDGSSSFESDGDSISGTWHINEHPRYTLGEYNGIPNDRLTSLHDQLAFMTPIQLFNIMWEGADELIKAESERYAQKQCGDHQFSTSIPEIRHFIGILLLSS